MRKLSCDSHDNLLKLECVFESENSIYVVLEILTGGQLFHRIQERNGYFSDEEVKEFMVGLLRGLGRMHSQRIMHRDLKPENIMLRSNNSMSPIIVDYGLATFADVEKYLFYRCGTPGYVAPEIIGLSESKHIEPQCDVFSAGVIFHILLTRKPLFEGTKYE
jgi:calcium-dependent protein kinase